MAESLPLGIDRVDTSTRENSLLDKPLPINLILVLLTWELLSDLEDLDQFSDCEPGPLPRQLLHLVELHLGILVSPIT